MKISAFRFILSFIASIFLLTPDIASAGCSGRDCCYKGSTKKNKVCLLNDNFGNFRFTGRPSDGAKRHKIQIQKEEKAKKGQRKKYYNLYGLAKNGKTVIKPICGHGYKIIDQNILVCPVHGQNDTKIYDWNGKKIADFASMDPVTVSEYRGRGKSSDMPRLSNGGILFRGDKGEGLQTYFYEYTTGQIASIGDARLLEWWDPSNSLNHTIGLKTKKEIAIDGRDKNLSVFMPLQPNGAPVKLPSDVIGVFDFHEITLNRGFGVLMRDDKGGYNFTLVSAAAWDAPFQTAGKPKYERIAVRGDQTNPRYKQAPRYYVRKLSGNWVQIDLNDAEKVLPAEGQDLAVLDRLSVQQLAEADTIKKKEDAAARQRGIKAYKQKKAEEQAEYTAMRDRLHSCIAGVYSRVNSTGWNSIPEPLLHWAIEAEYHLAKNTTKRFATREMGPNCSAYQATGTQAPAPLFSASDPKAFANAAAKIPDVKEGPKILRYMLAEMGKAGHSFADHRLVTLLREDLYKRKDASTARKQSELEAYSRMAKRGEGYGFAGLAGHASDGMAFQMTNENEAFVVLDNYAILRPMYERAVDAGYQPAQDNIRNIDKEMARAMRFISEGRAYSDYQNRVSMWRKCINPKGLERGIVIKCPKHMVPLGMRRVYSYTPWN